MPDLPNLPQTEAAIIEKTNAFRRQNGLGAVAPNKELAAAARWFAAYLARTGKFAHEADGREPHQRAAAHGYRYCMVGENLARNLDNRGFTTERLASEVMEGWKASPPHRHTLLEPAVTEIGVAVEQLSDRHPSFVSVQLFGRPEALKMEFKVRNTTGSAVSYAIAGEAHTIEPRTVTTHTICLPGELRFENAALSPGAGAGGGFAIGNGATYTIEMGQQGKLIVRRGDGRR